MDIDIIYQSVGKTRSGKIIPYTINREEIGRVLRFFETSKFSIDDLLDVFAVFEYLAVRSIRRGELEMLFDLYADDVFRLMAAYELQMAKEKANVVTVFDIFDLGRSLVNIEFVDL